MKKILHYTWYQQSYKIHKFINGLFYYLRKFPLLGKYIPANIYQSHTFKKVLHILFTIFSIPLNFLMKFFWLGVYTFLAIVASNLLSGSQQLLKFSDHAWVLGLLLWFLYVGVTVRFSSALTTQFSKKEREFMEFFRLPRETFFYAETLVEPLQTTIFYLPALFLYSLLARNGWLFLLGLLTPLTMKLSGLALSYLFFQKHISQKQRTTLFWFFFLFGIFVSPVVVFLRATLSTAFLIALLCLLLIGLFLSIAKLKNMEDLDHFLTDRTGNSLAEDQKVAEALAGNQYTRQGLQMQKKLSLDKQKDLSHLTGMVYLNALLFQRYSSILWKRTRNWLIAFAIALVAGLGGAIYFKEFLPEKTLLNMLPLTFMLMYACSVGRVVSQMVFVNCDVAMLNYPFYREPKTIIAGFNYRLKQIFKFNSIYAVSIFIILMVWGGFRYSLGFVALLILLLTALNALFSFHDLFIYYILQPFTKDMEVVNPVYKILSGALYWVAYINTQIRVASITYVIGISVVLLIYVTVGYFILLKRAPKTFALKA